MQIAVDLHTYFSLCLLFVCLICIRVYVSMSLFVSMLLFTLAYLHCSNDLYYATFCVKLYELFTAATVTDALVAYKTHTKRTVEPRFLNIIPRISLSSSKKRNGRKNLCIKNKSQDRIFRKKKIRCPELTARTLMIIKARIKLAIELLCVLSTILCACLCLCECIYKCGVAKRKRIRHFK